MKKINFVFGVHNHQPVGNFDFVFEEAYQKAYLPFIELVEKHPKIKISYHNTGILYDWLEINHPEFIKKIKKLVTNGQLELLTGGYYEPILAVIPDKDKLGQIQKHKNYLKNKFDYSAEGLWLAERIWEQHLVKSISEAGVNFIVIDDTHFKYAGFKSEDLTGYFKTEEQGKSINIFPISKKLRYTIPFQQIEETINYLRSWATEDGDNILVVADDGEKFGLWPETYESVYGEGWLDRFFSVLEKNSDWINMTHFSEISKTIKPLGLVYLPNASYAEMMHWALPTSKSYSEYYDFEKTLKNSGLFENYNQFVRGGFWRNFMAKYPESNHLHKKMLRVSNRANSSSSKKIDQVLDKIWMAQCNCPYWHGVFGGLYLPNLRSPIYRSLIEAESELDKIEKKSDITIETTDFNFDGKDEIILESNKFNLYFYPETGGALYELDFKPINFNLLDIVSRREEGYHKKILNQINENPKEVKFKEQGLADFLHYDWYRHGSLIDHFFGNDVTLGSFSNAQYSELGDFVNRKYKHSVSKDQNVSLSRNGHFWHDGTHYPISVKKTIEVNDKESEINIDYIITNEGNLKNVNIWFGVEFNFGLLAGNAPDRYYKFQNNSVEKFPLNSKGTEEDLNSIKLIDEWLGLEIELSFKKTGSIWRLPIETVSLSEGGFERVYQSSLVLPNWKIELEREFKISIKNKFTKINNK